jgi:hypothetical protein
MPLPRVRFTMRRMMVAVAVVAMLLCTGMQVSRMSYRAYIYRLKFSLNRRNADGYARQADRYGDPRSAARAVHSRILAEKYERAARYPWLPIEPDPPLPK